jgi:hypothetical protein
MILLRWRSRIICLAYEESEATLQIHITTFRLAFTSLFTEQKILTPGITYENTINGKLAALTKSEIPLKRN